MGHRENIGRTEPISIAFFGQSKTVRRALEKVCLVLTHCEKACLEILGFKEGADWDIEGSWPAIGFSGADGVDRILGVAAIPSSREALTSYAQQLALIGELRSTSSPRVGLIRLLVGQEDKVLSEELGARIKLLQFDLAEILLFLADEATGPRLKQHNNPWIRVMYLASLRKITHALKNGKIFYCDAIYRDGYKKALQRMRQDTEVLSFPVLDEVVSTTLCLMKEKDQSKVKKGKESIQASWNGIHSICVHAENCIIDYKEDELEECLRKMESPH